MFDKSTLNRIASVDELDHYIKVTNPSAWVVLVAALLLVVGFAIWSVFAIVPITVKTTGVTSDDKTIYCWVDESTAKKIDNDGASAQIGDIKTNNVVVSKMPMSSSEVVGILGSDFMEDALDLKDWNYSVAINVDRAAEHTDFTIGSIAGNAYLVPVSITVMETQPLFILLGK